MKRNILYAIGSVLFTVINLWSGYSSLMQGSYGWALLSLALAGWMGFQTFLIVRNLLGKNNENPRDY